MPETTTAIGRRAESAAAAFLERKGCEIVARNWRTRWCEIDIVAHRDAVLYFCEVKYRRNAYQGDGLAYITPAKLRQMSFAAHYWVTAHRWQGEYQLCAIAVAGDQFVVTDAIKEVVTA